MYLDRPSDTYECPRHYHRHHRHHRHHRYHLHILPLMSVSVVVGAVMVLTPRNTDPTPQDIVGL